VSADISIRPAAEADVELIFSLIVELAEYERAPEQVVGTGELLRHSLFGPHPAAEAVIAERDGEAVGFALFHSTFSTWECQPGIWLEDLYVPPQHRRGGEGSQLFAHVASVAVQRGCPRLEWTALEWNTPALSFYERAGAEVLDEWKLLRLSGKALELASR
jgi:GNAT superfamily N-acetyltransferase